MNNQNKQQTNFTSHQDEVFKKSKGRFTPGLKFFLLLIVMVIGLGVVWAIPQVGKAKNIYEYALLGKQNLDMAQAYVNEKDFSNAAKSFDQAKDNFETAKNNLDGIYFPKFLYGTSVGKQYVAADGLLVMGVNISEALSKVSIFIEDLYAPLEVEELTFFDLTIEQKRSILDKLFQSKFIFREVRNNLEIAVESLDKIPNGGLIEPLAGIVEPLKVNVPKFNKLINAILPIADVLPQLTGYPEPRTYLFLLQNSDELRPTGGFIGTYGIIKVQDADITYFDTDDIYNLDFGAQNKLQILAPEPIQKYLDQKYWFMRDANWSPDFPKAARKVEWFYHVEGGSEEKIDGIIAVTPSVIQSLVGLVGDMTLPILESQSITFTPENLTEELEYQVEFAYVDQGIHVSQRKDIVGDMADELINRLFELPLSQWVELTGIFETALNEKHLLILDKDPDINSIIEANGWAGEVKQTEGDYLMVVDANLASLKTDSVVEREIEYNINQGENGELISKVSITYHNNGEFNWRTTRLRTYTRVYTPLGSELIKGEGMMKKDRSNEVGTVDVEEDLGKTYFGAFISIEPGESRTLSFEYKLPSNIIENGGYELLIQKQAGTTGHDLKVGLNFNKDIEAFSPVGFGIATKVGGRIINFETDLKMDREFKVNLD